MGDLIAMIRRISNVTRSQNNKNMNKFTTTLTLSKESLKLLMLTMSHMPVTTTKGQLTQETTDTQVVLTVRIRRRSSATSIPKRTPARSPSRLARRLLTQSMLRSVRRESILTVRSPTREDTTVPEWLIITPRLLLLLTTLDITRATEGIITRKLSFLESLFNENISFVNSTK